MSTHDFNHKQFMSDIQRDFLFHIIMNSKHGMLSREKAQRLAKKFLTMKKNNSIKDLLHAMAQDISQSPEIHEVFVKHAPSFYEYEKQEQLSKIRQHEDLQKGGER